MALVAPSGAGKSTLLHVAGLLERPDGGDVSIDGRPCGAMSDYERTLVRRKDVGFVYQFHHVITSYSIHYTKLYEITSTRTSRANSASVRRRRGRRWRRAPT